MKESHEINIHLFRGKTMERIKIRRFNSCMHYRNILANSLREINCIKAQSPLVRRMQFLSEPAASFRESYLLSVQLSSFTHFNFINSLAEGEFTSESCYCRKSYTIDRVQK